MLPADELPAGVPAPSGALESPGTALVRRVNGQVADRQSAAELGRLGGLARAAKKARLRALECLGLKPVAGDLAGTLGPFLDDAEEFAQHEVERLAQTVGGGHCGAAPASLVQTAALQLAASRYLYSLGILDHLKLASSLGNDSRQNLLAAHELCAREAKARPQSSATDRAIAEILGQQVQ